MEMEEHALVSLHEDALRLGASSGRRKEVHKCFPTQGLEGRKGRVIKQESRWHYEVCGVLEELRAFQSLIHEGAFVLSRSPQRFQGELEPTERETLSKAFRNAAKNLEDISAQVSSAYMKLDAALSPFSACREPNEARALQTPKESHSDTQCGDAEGLKPEPALGENEHAQCSSDQSRPGSSPETELTPNSSDQNRTGSSSDTDLTPDSGFRCDEEKERDEDPQVKSSFIQGDLQCHNDVPQKEETKQKRKEWITTGLSAHQDDSHAVVPDVCFIQAPPGAAKVLRCEVADTLSCLLVDGAEELISRVIRVSVQAGATFPFPVAVGVPYHVRHRGSCRDVVVKVIDEKRRTSYIKPATTEEVCGSQKGPLAEVKVYSLGLFAVVSCLKRETYIIPKRGLSLKLPMDPRISLNYLPGSFTASVVAQTKVQPVDSVLLAAVKSRNDAYVSVVSASPLLYMSHPTSQPPRRPVTVTLPCAPNPERIKETKAQELQEHQYGATARLPSERVSVFGSFMKLKEKLCEKLTVLGARDKHWTVLDDVSIRQQQNGLVSFDLGENFDRLLVLRLLSPLQPCDLTSLAEALEESARLHSVTVVLQWRPDEPHAVSVSALPGGDLSPELSRLRARARCSVVETSSEISLHEGDQLLLRFSGNITAVTQSESDGQHERLTFHCQRRNQLSVRLTEVDPFGNHSSPCYKGAALFYRVTRGQLDCRGDKVVLKDESLLGNPVCKMPLTLPKRVKRIDWPFPTRVKTCENTPLSDALFLWLSGELSPEETSSLGSALRLSRGAAQLVKLRSRGRPSDHTFHILATWRRALPAVTLQTKSSLLAQCLSKIGRPDLAQEVLQREAQFDLIQDIKE